MLNYRKNYHDLCKQDNNPSASATTAKSIVEIVERKKLNNLSILVSYWITS